MVGVGFDDGRNGAVSWPRMQAAAGMTLKEGLSGQEDEQIVSAVNSAGSLLCQFHHQLRHPLLCPPE